MRIATALRPPLIGSIMLMAIGASAQPGLISMARNEPISRTAEDGFLINPPIGHLTLTAVASTDISEAVNTALASVASICGTVTIAPGSYIWGHSGIKMLPCETLEGVGATVKVTVSGATPFLIVRGITPPDPPVDTTYTLGSIRGITFVGPSAPNGQSSSTGIELGGANALETAQLFNFYDLHIRSFGCGVRFAFAHQIAFFGGSIEGNYDGICFANIITFSENINFNGTQILNNLNYGINHNQTGLNVELNLNACSVDYNGQASTTGGQIQITNGTLNIEGTHFENVTMPMITVPVPGAPAIVRIHISGSALNLADTDTNHSYTSFFDIKGLNDVLEVGRGVSFASQGARVSAVAAWNPIVNQNSRLLMDPYTYIVGTIPRGLHAYVGIPPNNFSYPTYDEHDNITGVRSTFAY